MKTPSNQTAFESAADKANHSTGQFLGTDNPRHLRGLAALQRGPLSREQGDRAVGCSNFPDLVAELRRRGLEIPCELVLDRDRDGVAIKRGVYQFTECDRRKVDRWLFSESPKLGAGDAAHLFGDAP